MSNKIIAELLTKIKNAKNKNIQFIIISANKLLYKILIIFKTEKIIKNFKIFKIFKKIYILVLLNIIKNFKINQLIQISKPSLKIYWNKQKIIKETKNKKFLISTSSGIITNIKASQLGIGGKILIKIN